MSTYECHQYKEGNQVSLLYIFIRFCRFLEGAFCRKFPISTRRNGRLKLGKLLSLIEHVGSKTGPFSISLHWYSETSGLSDRPFLTHQV